MSDQWSQGPGSGAEGDPTPPAATPPVVPPGFAAPAYGTPAYRNPSTPPTPGGPGPSPFGSPAVPGVPASPAPGGYGAVPPGGPATPYATPSPYAGVPTVAQNLASAPDPYARQDHRRRGSVGLPPSLGFAVMLLGVPALASTFYGLLAILGGLIFSSSDSEFSSEFGSDFNDAGSALAGIGVVLLALGLIGIWATVAMAAGSTTGRLVCTIFVGLCIIASFIGFLSDASAGGLFGLAVIILIPTYCLWAMWSGRSREIF